MSNYVVPEGMLKAARKAEGEWLMSRSAQAATAEGCSDVVLAAALRWQSENPQVPTSLEVCEMMAPMGSIQTPSHFMYFAEQLVRRMYLAPEPEASEEVKDLLWPSYRSASDLDRAVIEAYSRGWRSASTASR
jgi:hypothetical protein